MPLVGIGALPTPLSPPRVTHPPPKGGGGPQACGWGVGGESQFRRWATLGYSLYVRTLCTSGKFAPGVNDNGGKFALSLCRGGETVPLSQGLIKTERYSDFNTAAKQKKNKKSFTKNVTKK
jgi:hypothetical protein